MEILSPNQMTLAQYIWNRIVDDQVGLSRSRAQHSASMLYVTDRDIQKYIEEYWNAPLVVTRYLEDKYTKVP